MIVALVASALAGPYVAGGLAIGPVPAPLIIPTWRAGWASDNLVGWASLAFGALGASNVTDGAPFRGSVWRPRVGVRGLLGDPNEVRPFFGAQLSTLLVTSSSDGEDLFEQNDVSASHPPLGAGLAVGLTARVTESVALSPEFGVNYDRARYVTSGEVTSVGALTTVVSVQVDLFP